MKLIINFKKNTLLILCIIVGLQSYIFAQTPLTEAQRLNTLEEQLDNFAKKNKGLKEKAEIDINTDLKDLIATLAGSHNLNITVDNSINQPINTLLPEVLVKDLLLYLCKQYSLTLEFTGSIIAIKKYIAPLAAKLKPTRKVPEVDFNKFNDKLSIKAVNDTLNIVLSEITKLSGINISASANARNLLVSVDVLKADFDAALEQLAFENDLELSQKKAGFYTLSKPIVQKNQPNQRNNQQGRNNRQNNRNNSSAQLAVNFEFKKLPTSSDTILRINAVNQPIKDIIQHVSNDMLKDYYLFKEPTGNITLQLEDKTYEEFLTFILEGSGYTFRVENGIYLIGEFKQEGLLSTKLIQLQYRSFEKVEDIIPDEVKNGVVIKPFDEMNAFVVSGSPNKVFMVEEFLREIDKPVPNVMIELIILDVQRNKFVDIGIEAGIGDAPTTPGGQLYPTTNFTFSAQSVNNLLSLLSGQGVVNIGQVQPNFYASLTAIENNGYVKIKSKPQLSTLNAHKAKFTTGETRYYRIDRSNIQSGINPVVSNAVEFKELNADFTIEVTPNVSGNEQVTLTILVEQSDFLGEIQDDAPSPQVNRTFDSSVRIKNGEMIVLGGIDRKQTNDTGSGVPILARIPVIKWFFSKRTRNRQDSKLLIFIKPTIQF